MTPLVFNLIIIVASFIILVKASDLTVFGITNYAKKLGMSDYLIGLVIVSITASIPELVASFTGAVINSSGIVFGTILGSNIAGFTIILGILALYKRKLRTTCGVLRKTKMFTLILSIIPFLLFIDGKLSRIDGAVLVLLYFLFLFVIWKKEGEFGKLKKDVRLNKLYIDAIIFMGTLIAILLSARWLVFSSVNIANILKISPFFLGVTVIAICTNIPDLLVGMKAIKQGHEDVGFGDVLGSAMTKRLLFFGAIALYKPLTINFPILINSILFSIIGMIYIILLVEQKHVTWKHGLVMIFMYVGYILIESLAQ